VRCPSRNLGHPSFPPKVWRDVSRGAEALTASVRCGECGGSYELSDRRARDVRASLTRPVCPECRRANPGLPTDADYDWWRRRFSEAEIAEMGNALRAVAEDFGFRAR
jgi:hypothetical protein